jgi:cold shock CspA family protein
MARGTVVEFDDEGGYGTVREDGDAGTGRFFHCTAIADGTRTIEVGAEVQFDVVAGLRGVYEARNLTPAGTTEG